VADIYAWLETSHMASVSRYHPVLVAMHWLLALLITAALALGALVMARIPNADPTKIEALRAHMGGGILIVSLMLLRFAIRTLTRRPAAADTGSAKLNALAAISHGALYVLVLGMGLSGVFMALQAGLFDVVFGGRGRLPPDLWVFPVRTVHYAFSRLLMALIVLHITGAIYHTFVRRDGLLRRMWFGRRWMAEPPRQAEGQAAGKLT
jgi:cytochrome b561